MSAKFREWRKELPGRLAALTELQLIALCLSCNERALVCYEAFCADVKNAGIDFPTDIMLFKSVMETSWRIAMEKEAIEAFDLDDFLEKTFFLSPDDDGPIRFYGGFTVLGREAMGAVYLTARYIRLRKFSDALGAVKINLDMIDRHVCDANKLMSRQLTDDEFDALLATPLVLEEVAVQQYDVSLLASNVPIDEKLRRHFSERNATVGIQPFRRSLSWHKPDY